MQSPSLLHNPAVFTLRFASLGEALEAAGQAGSHLWLAAGDQPPAILSYRELLARATLAAQHLVEHGLRRGDRVIIMLPTGEAWLLAFFGTLLAGGVAVPIGPTFSFGGLERYAQTIRHIAIDAGARLFVGTQAVEPYLPVLREGNTSLEEFIRPELFTTEPRSSHRSKAHRPTISRSCSTRVARPACPRGSRSATGRSWPMRT